LRIANFLEGFLIIWTIKAITTLIGLFDNSVGDSCKFYRLLLNKLVFVPYGGNKQWQRRKKQRRKQQRGKRENSITLPTRI
jgi:hypothetical protein